MRGFSFHCQDNDIDRINHPININEIIQVGVVAVAICRLWLHRTNKAPTPDEFINILLHFTCPDQTIAKHIVQVDRVAVLEQWR